MALTHFRRIGVATSVVATLLLPSATGATDSSTVEPALAGSSAPEGAPVIVLDGRRIGIDEHANIMKVQGVANELEAFAREGHPDDFAGLRIVDTGRRIVVHLTRNDADLRRVLTEMAADVPLSFEEAERSELDLARVRDELARSVDALAVEGVRIISIAPQISSNRVVVGIAPSESEASQDVAGAQRLLAQRFGPAVLATPAGVDPVLLSNRWSDSSPWNGGAFITAYDGGDCSSGIPVRNAQGQHYLVTAAHCFAYGRVIYNASQTIPIGNAGVIGAVTHHGYNHIIDAELIATVGASSNLTFTGSTLSTTRGRFVSSGGTQPGSVVCHSGAWEGPSSSWNPQCRRWRGWRGRLVQQLVSPGGPGLLRELLVHGDLSCAQPLAANRQYVAVAMRPRGRSGLLSV